MMNRKHGLFLFLAACIPGCGEMYQGYMKRGISLLTAFCGLFALAVFLEVGGLTVLMLPVWLFSFFDSYNLRSQMDEGTAEPDGYLFSLEGGDGEKLSALYRRRHSIIGWCLVLLGGYALFRTLISGVLGFWLPDWLYSILIYDVPRLAATVGIIALGLWFIRGPKGSGRTDYQPYTPSAAEPESGEQTKVPAEPEENGHGEN